MSDVLLHGPGPVLAAGESFVRRRVQVTAGTREGTVARIERCSFVECEILQWRTRRVEIADVLFRDCTSDEPMWFENCILRRVEFSGVHGDIQIDSTLGLQPQAARVEVACAYADVDWALDLVNCWPRTLEISSSFPLEKIRYSRDRAAVFDMRFYEKLRLEAPGVDFATQFYSPLTIAEQDGASRAFLLGEEWCIAWLRREGMTLD